MARLWPAYLMRHGQLLARLVFSNEKACWPWVWGRNKNHMTTVSRNLSRQVCEWSF